MRSEGALHDQTVGGAVKDPTPAFELEDAIDDLVRVELHHAPVVEELTTEHGVREVDLPAVLGVDVADARGDAALGHDGVGLAEQRFAHHRDAAAGLGGGDGGTHARAAGADDEHVTFDGVVWLGCRCHLRRRCADRRRSRRAGGECIRR